ncbi:CHASE domain-containing protein [Hyalangium versicolor]|uniref:CHASE domain-containing protein n=1 Tax=Hyalangium versicolor TaxID=2861190 RepID=UPI001CCFD360|nr:CHASE domain-containing protein [Hyalangium versicolor]
MLRTWLQRRPLPYWLSTLLLALAYVLSGRAGLLLAIPPGYATAIFPSAGIALAGLLMGGYRMVPAIWLGSTAMNFWVSWGQSSQDPLKLLLVSACLGTGAALQAAAGLFLVRPVSGPRPLLQKLDEILRILLLGGPVACLISATVGTSVLLGVGAISGAEWPLSWLIWWVGDGLGVLVVLPMTLAACNWPEETWKGRRHTVLWPLLVCLTITVFLFVRVSQSEQHRTQTEFERHAERAARSVEANLTRNLQAAQATRRFMEVTDRNREENFHHFVRGDMDRQPALHAVSWAPRVLPSEVAAYEARLQARLGPQARLIDWPEDGLRHPVEPRAEYYPLTFIELRSSTAKGMGADILSEPIRGEALRSALARNELALTARLHLLSDTPEQWSVLAILPVQDPPSGNTVGVVTMVLRLEDIVRQSLDPDRSSEIRFTIWDATAPQAPQLMYGDAAPQSWGEERMFSLPVKVGNRTWFVRVHETQEGFANSTRRWQTWAVLAGGLLFTGLLAVLLLDQSGEKARVAALVAERTQTLHQREQFLSAVLQSALDGLLTLDERGRVLSANPASGRLLGLTTAEWEGLPLTQVLPSLDWPTLRAELDQLPPESPGLRRESSARRRDGTEVPVELALSNASASGVRTYVCLLHDLSERTRVNRMKDEFVSTVSHELRTPLTSILGALSLITRGGLVAQPEVLGQLLSIAENNAQRLLQLINDLLDVDKMEAGHLALQCRPAELAPLLARSQEENRGYAERFQVSLTLLSSVTAGTWAEVDVDRFAQVMNNLLSNAIKFSPTGGAVELGMTVERDWLEVSVRDHGSGIPVEFQPQLFRKFSQADSSDTRRQRGTGLGLYLTRILVERMRGEIRFETAEGQGTTFFIRLPRIPAPQPEQSAMA